MFNGNKVIDTDGHVMEPNDLYDHYLETKFKPDLENLKKEAEGRPSKFFFGISISSTPGVRSGCPIPTSRWCAPGATRTSTDASRIPSS